MSCATPQWMIEQGFSPTFAKRFWAKVNKTESCWIWTACKNKQGYGKIGKNGNPREVVWAYRASWLLNRGPIPPGLHVLHNCPGGDNPPCVNPAHLWLGTHLDNVADMNRKGRHGSNSKAISGENNPNAKLSDSDVAEIRKLRSGGIKRDEVAARFGISSDYVRELTGLKSRVIEPVPAAQLRAGQ